MARLNLFLTLVLIIVFVVIWQRKSPPVTAPKLPAKAEKPAPPPKTIAPKTSVSPPIEVEAPSPLPPTEKKKKKLVVPFKVDEDGIAIVQGDVAIGKPTAENPPRNGIAVFQPPQKWPSRTIPYYIQPTVINPDRVKAALAMFDQTAVRFVPHTDQPDALVFEDGKGVCKSYVGRIGGLQPVWIPARCSPADIAHEIMHALGFIHEQNRTDRDDSITVLNDNIEDEYRDNFEKLPPEFMFMSGLGPFDFESQMIYPVWMFAKGGQVTMEPKNHDRQIHPSDALSPSDIARINQGYGQLPN